MKAVLGLKLDPWHDTGAAIVLDDGVRLRVAAISQERLDRVKNSRAFPAAAIAYCLDAVGCQLGDLSLVVSDFILTPGTEDYAEGSGQPEPVAKRKFFTEISALGIPWVFAEHHLCHAASAYFGTEWEEAAALVIDGHGSNYETQTLFRCQGNGITKLTTSHRPGIGWMYGVVSEALLGFGHLQEGKTMGLAGWAKSAGRWRQPFSGQKQSSNPFELSYDQFLHQGRLWQHDVPAGLPRRIQTLDPLGSPFVEYAFAAQAELEAGVMELVRAAARISQCKRLCYSGGVALNIPANRLILDSGLFEGLFIQPAASDSGIPLGAALLGYYSMLGGTRRWNMEHAFLGREYTADSTEAALSDWGGHRTSFRPDEVARILDHDYLVAWFQGASEFGPRALGHRSILCLPRHAQMKAFLNREVKHREMFRPFAPIVPIESQGAYFDLSTPSPFMLLNSRVCHEWADAMPAVVHADGTARVQSIRQDQQPELHQLLNEVGRRCGIPVLLNTSLNLAGEPIVERPAEAIDLFMRSKLDALVLGDHLLTKLPLRQMLDRANPGPMEMASTPLPQAVEHSVAIPALPSTVVVLAPNPDHPLYSSWIPHCQWPVQTVCRYGPEWEPPADTALLVTHDTYTEPGMTLIRRAVEQGVPTLILADGILEYRNTWEHPQLKPGAIFQPVLGHKIACLGRSQARLLESWNNVGKCEIVGAPRFDRYSGRQRRNRRPTDPFRVLVATALTPAFTSEHRIQVLQSLRDLKDYFHHHPQIGGVRVIPLWRLTKGLDSEIGVPSEASDFSGRELAAVLQQVDAVITTPSTTQLEGMLLGLPVAILDYTNTPHYVAAAWRITAQSHLATVLEELVNPTAPKMLVQDTILHDALECTTPATARLLALIEQMVVAGQEQLAVRPRLVLPKRILPTSDVEFAPAEPRFRLEDLYPAQSAVTQRPPTRPNASEGCGFTAPPTGLRDKILFVSHEASRTGAPLSLLHLLRWLRRHTELQFRVLLRQGGPLESKFRQVAETYTADTFRPAESLLADVALIYSNTSTNGLFIDSLPHRNIPVITHIHELENVIEIFGLEGFRAVRNHTSHYLACSRAVVDCLVEHHGIARDRVTLHYESIPVAEVTQHGAAGTRGQILRELGVDEEAFVLTACGRTEWRKGVDVFLQVAAAVRRRVRPDRKLAFLWMGYVTKDERSTILRRDVRLLGLEDCFHFIGETTNAHSLLAASDLFCLTSREDPFPLVMLEAGVLGKAVIAFEKSGGAPEYCELGGGVTVPYLDVETYAAQCVRLLDDQEERHRIGRRAVELVQERFDVERTAAQWLEHIQHFRTACTATVSNDGLQTKPVSQSVSFSAGARTANQEPTFATPPNGHNQHRQLNYTSHIGQDAWVAECLQFKRGGFFLDFGAFDGTTISNTCALEKELGWRGICVEPNSTYYPAVCESRQVITVNAALWPKSRELLRFVDAHGLSSLEQFKDSDANSSKREQATRSVIEVDTLNPTELLKRFNAPQLIDYLSLDVEGCEFDVLSALDLNQYAIALMTIEHNHDAPRQERIRKHLAAYGYECVQNRNDDFFFHRGHLARCLPSGAAMVDPVAVCQRIYHSYAIGEPGGRKSALISPAEQTRALLAQAEEYVARGEIAEAERAYLAAVTTSPGDASAFLARGLFLFATERVDEACQHFRKSIDLAPDLPAAHLQLASCLVHLGRLPEAEARARAALRLAPGDVGALQLLAALLKHRGQFEEAGSLYAELMRRLPKDVSVALGRAECHAQQGHEVLAELLYEEILERDPSCEEAKAALAKLQTPPVTAPNGKSKPAVAARAGNGNQDNH